MARSTALARKTTKMEKRVKSANKRAQRWKEEATGTMPALWRGFTILSGAAAAGAVRAKMPEVAGVPVEVVGGLLVGGAGLATRSAMAVNFATGWLAPYVADMVEEAVSTAGQGEAPAPSVAAI